VATSATTANTVIDDGGVPQLQFSPGRVDPANAAFTANRKPLAANFTFNGYTLFVIANHFVSKGADQPLFGRFQPPAQGSAAQRQQQAAAVAGFVQAILAVDADANVIVLGDLNDFEFSPTLGALATGTGLQNLVETLPAEERYSYVFEGNSQVLDHLLVSAHLAAVANPEFDIVHVNAEYAAQASDHDPVVARLTLAVADTDGDAVPDASDNCMLVPNPTQLDTDGDGYGNACDADLDNSGLVNFADLALFRLAFGSSNPHADFDGNAVVNFADLASFRQMFGRPPGP
jgi:hypothetical protein